MNRLDLSQPMIHCHIDLDEALPSSAYPIVGRLAEALETASVELSSLYEEVEDTEIVRVPCAQEGEVVM